MRAFLWSAAVLAVGLAFAPRAAAAGEASPDAGAERLYRRYCASCHGDDFSGGERREFIPELPDFTSAAWHAGRSDARLLVSILDGKGSGMPSFRRKLSEEQARGLVARLRRAAPAFVPSRPPDGGPNDFDRRYEELTSEMDSLKKQFYESAGAKRREAPAPDAPRRAD